MSSSCLSPWSEVLGIELRQGCRLGFDSGPYVTIYYAIVIDGLRHELALPKSIDPHLEHAISDLYASHKKACLQTNFAGNPSKYNIIF